MTKRHVTANMGEGQRAGGESAPMQVLTRGLRILGQFTAQEPALSLSELGRRTGLHRATVHRFAKALQAEGFLTLDAVTGLYRVGPAWAAALFVLGGNSILSEILNHDLQALAETTGEAVSLSVRKGDQIQMISVVSTSSSFVPAISPGPFVPLSEHALVHARIHLAYSDEQTRKRMTAVPAIRHTDQTVTDRAVIEARLVQEAAAGIAYSREAYRRGASALAVPVFSQGDVVAALGLVVPTERFDANVESYSRVLRDAAAAMGRRLDEGFTRGAAKQ
jgi:DNA-binding IclR family transcriptional regulator